MHLVEPPLIPAGSIARRVREMGASLSACYADRRMPIVLLAVLRGSVVFAADLMRAMAVPTAIDFIRAKSYAGTRSTGRVEITQFPEVPLKGRDVLVVDDILDTGRTTAAILDFVREQNPASAALCTLLDKPARRAVSIQADFSGFSIEDRFVVGYGLDYEERYRGLPSIYELSGEEG